MCIMCMEIHWSGFIFLASIPPVKIPAQFILAIDMEIGKMATSITFVDCFDKD